jgi:RNA polymerase sigma factor (sigma-70 family)
LGGSGSGGIALTRAQFGRWGSASADAELLAAEANVALAFDVFYRRHREAVLTLLHFECRGDTHLALDLTAEVFATAYLERDRFRPERGAARAWLFGIARKKAAASRRRWRREDSARRKLGARPRPFSEAGIEQAEGLIDGEKLVAGLPDHERAAVWARVVEDRSYGEIAQASNVAVATVRSRVSRGLASLSERARP